jgi:hypothetical protein
METYFPHVNSLTRQKQLRGRYHIPNTLSPYYWGELAMPKHLSMAYQLIFVNNQVDTSLALFTSANHAAHPGR